MSTSSKNSSQNIREDDDLIWHYTSFDVFKKMICGETGLYATHVRFLNDSSEFRYGWKIIMSMAEKYVEERKKQHKETKSAIEKLQDVQQQIKSMLLNIKIENYKKTDVYVTCFSKECDNLYQWRCYTPQGGVCIGFSRQELQQRVFGTNQEEIGKIRNVPLKTFSYHSDNSNQMDSWGCLCDCIYDEKEQKQAVIKFIFSEPTTQYANIFFLACLMKHDSFVFEQEERIVYSGASCYDKLEMIGGKPRIPVLGASPSEIRQLIKGVVVSPPWRQRTQFILGPSLGS